MRALFATLALIIFALIAFSGCSQDEKANLARRIVYHKGGGNIQLEWTIMKLPNGDTALHGVRTEYYWSGAAKKSEEWKDGKKDGTAQAWYDNNQQQWQKSYEKGVKAKVWRLFFSDGNPWLTLAYKDGLLDGTIQKWDRMNPGVVQEAVFSKGNCVSGACDILNLPEAAEDAPQAEKVMVNRDREILTEFLD